MLALVILVVLSVRCSAEYPSAYQIANLNPNNIDLLVIQSDEIWMVKFYSPSTDRSSVIFPPFLQASVFLLGLIESGAVNIDDHTSLKTKYNIQRVPTILIFGDNKYHPEEYSGPLTSQGIVDAVLDVKIIRDIERKFGTKSGSGSPANTNTNTHTNINTTNATSSYSTLVIISFAIGISVLIIIIIIILLRHWFFKPGARGW